MSLRKARPIKDQYCSVVSFVLLLLLDCLIDMWSIYGEGTCLYTTVKCRDTGSDELRKRNEIEIR